MARIVGALLFLLIIVPARAQSLFSGPTVWGSASTGVITWTADPYSPSTDVLMNGLSVHVVSSRWMLQIGYLESDRLHLDLSGAFSGLHRQAEGGTGGAMILAEYGPPEVEPYAALTFRTTYAAIGPQWQRWGLFGAVTAGPAVTWGARARYERRTCLSGCPYSGYVQTTRVRNSYTVLGLAGRIEGGFRLAGRVWLGGMTALIVNGNSAHASTSLALRVDLLRPDR